MQRTALPRKGAAACVDLRAIARGILTLPFLASCLVAQTPNLISLQTSSEIAPPGGWAQIKVSLRTPALIQSGDLTIDLDPTIFGEIETVSIFSATGDAYGYANVRGQHVDAHFISPSAAIGQLPGLPVLQLSVPVLAAAQPGTKVAITPSPGLTWKAPGGAKYAVTIGNGSFTVGGGLSVRRLTPISAMSDGTNSTIEGTGFDASTQLTIDGVTVSVLAFVNDRLMRAAISLPEITGKHMHLSNAGGTVDYFTALPSAPSNQQFALPGVHAILPIVPLTRAGTSYNNLLSHPAIVEGFAILNPSRVPVDVTFQGYGFLPPGSLLFQQRITVPASALYFVNLNGLANSAQSNWHGSIWVSASAPVRMLDYLRMPTMIGELPDEIRVLPPLLPGDGPTPVRLAISSATVSWSWQTGSALPAPSTIDISGIASAGFGFTASSAASWIQLDPAQGTVPGKLILTPKLAGLAPGKYTASVTIAPTLPASLAGYPVQTTSVAVDVTVSAVPLIGLSGTCCTFVVPTSPGPRTAVIISNGSAAAIAIAVSTASGGTWLSVTSSSMLTPATLTVTANAAGLAAGTYDGQIAVMGPANMLTLPVELDVTNSPGGATLQVQPSSLSFVLETGAPPPLSSQLVSIQPIGASITQSVKTESGGDWLISQLFSNAPAPAALNVNASAAKLDPGTYRGKIAISAGALGSAEVAVQLTVLPKPSTGSNLKVTPPAISIVSPAGQTGSATFTVDTGAAPGFFSISLDAAGTWFQIAGITSASTLADGRYSTPASVTVSAIASQPGTYYGTVVVTSAGRSINVPLTLSAGASTASPPVISTIVNGASLLPGPLAPGEIFSVFGAGVGLAPTGLVLDSMGGVATTLGGTQVLVNNIPAPLLYVSANQINAIAPYQPDSLSSTVQVVSNGAPSERWSVPGDHAAPAIFTVPGTGVGQAAVLNHDNTVNGSGNPAARGSVIQIFATGEGQTSPAGVTGSVNSSATKMPVLPVQVKIGGVDAPIQYRGGVPDAVAGLLQVNAVVPEAVAPGVSVPITLIIGGVASSGAATVAIR